MDAQSPRVKNYVRPEDFLKLPKTPVSRRDLLKLGFAGTAAATLATIDSLAWIPQRLALAASVNTSLPDIQFDISNYIAPAQTFNGIPFRFGPVYTVFLTARLNSTPDHLDQQDINYTLNTIEAVYPFSPSGIFTFIAYGLPYFRRLPGGLTGSLVSSNMPRLLSDTSRYVLEEAVPGPTDVSPQNPNITKKTFNVRVGIESNDILFTLRSDVLSNINSVVNWFFGSNKLGGNSVPSPQFASNGLLSFTTVRTQFTQIGLPRQIADAHNLPFASQINPQSPMWMGFSDQQVSASGPASIVTLRGNSSATLTTATSGSYFDNGSIQHLSQALQDLNAFYAHTASNSEPFTERVQYMFRSDPIPSLGNTDQFTDGGGTAFLANDASIFLKYKARGTTEAMQTAANPNRVNDPQPDGSGVKPRMGHLSALQQSSRAADGTPMHIRMDGPGFGTVDVPDGSSQPKLHFTMFIPTADFFKTMRINQAALRFQTLQAGSGGSSTGTVDPDDNGLERFITATRRQNFLCPPRRHRAFPLLEFTPNTATRTRATTTRKQLPLSGLEHL
jgi:hypothetical protein